MSEKLDPLEWGPKNLRKWIAKATAKINSNTPKQGNDISVSENPDGSVISVASSATVGRSYILIICVASEPFYLNFKTNGAPTPVNAD